MIVVTGMHRSGTSMIANILLEFGIGFGDPSGFYKADQWNPKGYLEQCEIIDLNSRLICKVPNTTSQLYRSLSQVLYLLMPGPERIRKRAQRIRGEILELGSKYRGLAVKDPRFCVTLDAWKSMVPIKSTVVCIRHPWEVVASLKRRQNIPLKLGLKFWDYHIASLLATLPREESVLVDYNNLTGPNYLSELERLLSFLCIDLSRSEVEARFQKVFTQELYHCSEVDSTPLPPKTKQLWDALIELYNSKK